MLSFIPTILIVIINHNGQSGRIIIIILSG